MRRISMAHAPAEELVRTKDTKGRRIATTDGKPVDRGRPCTCPSGGETVQYLVDRTQLRGVACAECRGTLGII